MEHKSLSLSLAISPDQVLLFVVVHIGFSPAVAVEIGWVVAVSVLDSHHRQSWTRTSVTDQCPWYSEEEINVHPNHW